MAAHALASPNASFPFQLYWATAAGSRNEVNSYAGEAFGLLGCVELCGVHGGVPLCPSSYEELRFVMANVTNTPETSYWTGVFKDPDFIGEPHEGWECVDGSQPAIKWVGAGVAMTAAPAASNPQNKYGAEYCTTLGSSLTTVENAGFRDVSCRGSWRPCACGGPGNVSARFELVQSDLDATADIYDAELKLQLALSFIIAIAASSCCSGVFCVTRTCARLRRRRELAQQKRAEGAAAVERTKERLNAAGKAAASLRARVSLALLQLGFTMFVVSLTPILGTLFELYGTRFSGPFTAYLCFMPPGCMLMLLAVRATDATTIRAVGGFLFGLTLFFFVMMGLASWVTSFNACFQYYSAVSLVSSVLFVRPMLCSCCGTAALPPRAALRQLWLAARFFIFCMGGVTLWWPIMGDIASPYNYWSLIYAVISIVNAAAMTPRVRGFAHRWLGGLGKTGTKEAEAASIASLIGGVDAGKALAEGAKRFRALPLSSLAESDLDSSTDSGLHRKTKSAALGDVDCFVSHSWSDAGAAKYARLHEWARGDDVRSDGEQYPLIWLDKACIDQSAIVENLQALPVFLSGCRSLFVLAGPTYPSRLWCVVELFVWIRVGGAKERIKVAHMRGGEMQSLFAQFDASRAKCFKPKDRQHLLAVIESGFGDLLPFNKCIRALMADAAVSEAVRPEDLDNSDVVKEEYSI